MKLIAVFSGTVRPFLAPVGYFFLLMYLQMNQLTIAISPSSHNAFNGFSDLIVLNIILTILITVNMEKLSFRRLKLILTYVSSAYID